MAKYKVKTFMVSFEIDEPRANYKFHGAEDVFKWAKGIYASLDADKEHFAVIALNQKNRFVGMKIISTGTLTATLVHPREVYRAALELDAAALIFLHNHPSGEPRPSPEDIALTKQLKQVGDVHGIRVLDHVVVGHERYYSFSDMALL